MIFIRSLSKPGWSLGGSPPPEALIQSLVEELYPQSKQATSLTANSFRDMLQCAHEDRFDVVFITNLEGVAIAAGLLIPITTAFGTYGLIEGVVVDKHHRRAGPYNEILMKLIQLGKKRKFTSLILFSQEGRKTQEFYEKLNFTQKDTDVYKLTL